MSLAIAGENQTCYIVCCGGFFPCGKEFRITSVSSERSSMALFTNVPLVENTDSMLPLIIVCILPTYDDFGNHR